MIDITHQEREILLCLKEGMVQKTIAERMLISVRELERKISYLKERFSCPNIAALIAFAYENGLVNQMAETRHRDAV